MLGWSILAVLVAYLVGSIPTAYVVVRLVRGIDIRTVGSGNVGATNAGRVLGMPFFWLVFLVDLGKGLVPTIGLPWVVSHLTENGSPGLAVFVAVSAIVGHNFPIYLNFHGGKGVATSLGAVIALDPIASVSALGTFVVFLVITSMVSLSSLLSSLIFVTVHFGRVSEPWSGREVVMSVATVVLVTLLIWRHRTNLARIARGTEPRIRFTRRTKRSGEEP